MARTRYYSLLVFLLFASCSKHHDSPAPVGSQSTADPIPAAELVSTQVLGIANPPDGVTFSSQEVDANKTSWPFSGLYFSVDTVTSDRYFTRLFMGTAGLDVEPNKTISLTPTGVNYSRIKPIKMTRVGTWRNGTGGTFGDASSGSITFPANALVESSTGYYTPTLNADVKMGYLSPLSADFGISSPGYPVADAEGQRWYLSSVGIIDVNLGYFITDYPAYFFYSTNTGTLTMPIAPGITAPDSVPVWHLTAGKWTRSATAHKSGNTYVASVHEYGAFNFALPVKGAYTTLHFQTGDNVPLINANFQIINNTVLYEGQTDWEGNALVFLPAGISGSVMMQYPGGDPTIPTSIPAGPISTVAPAKTLTINVKSPSLICTLSGTANNCDGSPIKSGKVIVYNTHLKKLWHLPIANGLYKSAIIDGSYGPMVYALKAVNSDTHVSGADTGVAIAAGSSNSYTLNTCPAISALFMKYSVDGIAQTISGDRSTPGNPTLEASLTPDERTFVASGSSGKGLQFSTYAWSTGVFTGSGIYSLAIDGIFYSYNPTKPMRVAFDRYDLLSGGLITGSADFYYNDGAGVMHYLQCSFQVVRL